MILGPNDPDLTWCDLSAGGLCPRDEGNEIGQTIGVSSQDHDADIEPREVLLILEVLIRGQEDLELRGCSSEELAIRETGPASVEDGLRVE